MKRILVNLDDETANMIKQKAELEYRSLSNAAAIILKEGLSKKGPTTKAAKKKSTTKNEHEESKKQKSHWIADIWNLHCDPLPACRTVASPERKKLLKQIEKTYSKEEIISATKTISESPFARGFNDRGWRASFDWFIKPESIAKIIEGKYDERRQFSKTEIEDMNQMRRLGEIFKNKRTKENEHE